MAPVLAAEEVMTTTMVLLLLVLVLMLVESPRVFLDMIPAVVTRG